MRSIILQGVAFLATIASVGADTDTDVSATATVTSTSTTTAAASTSSSEFTTVPAASVSTSTSTESFTTVPAASTTTTCAAENIVDACLDTTESYVSLCGATDYQCLCDKYVAIVICFDNCPDDARAPSYEAQRDSYCQTASLYATTSSNLTWSRTLAPTPASAATTSTNVIIKSVDVSATAAATESGNDAQERITRVGGILAGVAGFVAIFL
ncbi:hypothetical protein F5Y02DRAFT_85162 [Annulohypoxylon stygium]|nr:hypothetical protein F5Y02DRAFT_85162 [Annulohypoxylon stygium]